MASVGDYGVNAAQETTKAAIFDMAGRKTVTLAVQDIAGSDGNDDTRRHQDFGHDAQAIDDLHA